MGPVRAPSFGGRSGGGCWDLQYYDTQPGAKLGLYGCNENVPCLLFLCDCCYGGF